jgi:hypothetical protein
MAVLHGAGPLGPRALPLAADRPLRFDAAGEPDAGGAWVASVLRLEGAARAQLAVVSRPGARASVNGRPVAGVAELVHGDHLFVGEREWIASLDAVPTPTKASAACPACCETPEELLCCPRCGAPWCERCWRRAPDGRCPTAGCEQPADLERAPWTPSPSDFVAAWEESP